MAEAIARRTVVGTRARRLDVDDKVTGFARYASDLSLPGMLFGKIVRSDRPHARIVRIDISAAERVPGVEAVITASHGGGWFGEVVKDMTPFAGDRVRFVGDPIAAVAAESEAIAEFAARLIDVDYEPLPAVFDPLESLESDAPLVHDDVAAYDGPADLVRFGNVCARVTLQRGDIDLAFAGADCVVEGAYTAHSAHQAPLEPRAALADVDARGRLTIYAGTQFPFGVREQLHQALCLPHGHIRVVAQTLGGGFGAKMPAHAELYAALLSRKTGRPVRVVNTREEDLSFGNPRHPMMIRVRSAVAADGTILGRDVTSIMDAGAYATSSPVLAGVATLLAPGPYRIPNLKVEVLAVHTNNMPSGAYRGPTGPQTAFAIESHTDEIARTLGADPLAFRLKNVFAEGDIGHSGQALFGVGLRETLGRAAEAIGWGKDNEPTAPGMKRGKGLSCAWWPTATGSSACGIQLNEDGTVLVQTGAVELGPGALQAGVPQIVAEELGVPVDRITLVWGDTDATPLDAGAHGSRTLFNVGNAALRAARQVKQELIRRAAVLLEAAEFDLELRDGEVVVRGVPDRGVAISELTAGQMWSSEPILGRGTFRLDAAPNEPDTLRGSLVPSFDAPTFHCHAADVEVDPETGLVQVNDFVVAQDVGFAINPTYVEGQMQGGAAQGIGYTLTEQLVVEDGHLLNPNLALYRLPTTLDTPAIQTAIVEHPSKDGPHGAKGVGEPPVVASPAAIANAVTDAIGSPIRSLPLTPERVLRAIRGNE